MARRRRQEEHENHERWLISYADFITLLFAFFVVMYSISSINEGKYRVLSDSLIAAFRHPPRAVEPVQVGQPAKAPTRPQVDFMQRPNVLSPLDLAQNRESGRVDAFEGESLMRRIAGDLRRALGDLVEAGMISVRYNDLWIEVEIRESVLFESGSARLENKAIPVLGSVAEVLLDEPYPIRVEGFTDHLPINTLLYPSNWELSTARASAVVRLLGRQGIAPQRMSALGYGEYRPVADNATAEGRARNRRVVIVVLASDQIAHLMDASTTAIAPGDGRAPARGASPALPAGDGGQAIPPASAPDSPQPGEVATAGASTIPEAAPGVQRLAEPVPRVEPPKAVPMIPVPLNIFEPGSVRREGEG